VPGLAAEAIAHTKGRGEVVSYEAALEFGWCSIHQERRLMRNGLSITVVGLSLTVLFAVTYVLAVIFCLVAAAFSPTSGMMTSADTISNMMQAALPGFGWHVVGVFTGLLLTAVYGFYAALIFVPAYNYFQHRFASSTATTVKRSGEPIPASR
jgi:hypothetical protein